MPMDDGAPAWRPLAERLKLVREITGKTQGQMAELLGVAQSQISEVENLKAKPSVEMLLGVSENFDWISRDWLLTGRGEYKRSNQNPRDARFSPPEQPDVEAIEAVIDALRAFDALSQVRTSRKVRARLYAELMNDYMGAYMEALSKRDLSSKAREIAARRTMYMAVTRANGSPPDDQEDPLAPR